jgi:phosphohistidine phosphatase
MIKQFKLLHVVRHAKSAWNDEGVADIDRSLKPKGIINAYEISRKLKLDHLIPDKIVTSPADRALHTAVIFARIFEYPLEHIEIRNVFYESSIERIIDFIRKTDDAYKSLMIFGHNPEFTDLVNMFTQSELLSIPTAGVVTLKFNAAAWKDVHTNNLENQKFNFPE